MPKLLRRTSPKPQQQTQRRFARRQWARRWLTWKWIVAAVVVLALIAASIWLVFFSATLSVRDTEVSGNDYLSDGDVLAAADIPTGDPLATADLDQVKRRIEALAPVKSVDVVRSWPDTVTITITERQPIAVVELGDEFRGMDEEGVLFRNYSTAPKDLPVVRGSEATSTTALAEAATVIGALPSDLASDVSHVDVESRDQISLALRGGAVVVWGGADQSEDKARVLASLLETRPDAKYFNVTVPGTPAVAPKPPKLPTTH